MSTLKIWEEKIRTKRQSTPFRQFVKEIASWEVLNLYRNNGKISRYPETGRVKWLNDKEFLNAGKYFLDYDFGTDFFSNFQHLHDVFPFQWLMQFGPGDENCQYADAIFGAKNAYLTFVSGLDSEDTAYSAFVHIRTKNVLSSFFITTDVTNAYMSGGVTRSMNVFYSRYVSDSSNVWFSSNLIGCEECLFCDDLQNQKYCIENVPYERSEYFAKKEAFLREKAKFDAWNRKVRERKGKNFASQNVRGSYLVKCENVENGAWTIGVRNARNSLLGIGAGDCDVFADCIDYGANSHDAFACPAMGNNSQYVYCSSQIDQSSNIYYGYFLQNCSFCIGCIGLKNKSFCILNKQYSPEEWHELADRIFADMEKGGVLGNFFPGSTNPFYFNDTLAALILPDFTKEEVEQDGYLWRDGPIKVDIPEGSEVVDAHELDRFEWFDANGIWTIYPQVKDVVVRDPSGDFYRIIPMEYDFLVNHALPLPRIHWLERIQAAFKM